MLPSPQRAFTIFCRQIIVKVLRRSIGLTHGSEKPGRYQSREQQAASRKQQCMPQSTALAAGRTSHMISGVHGAYQRKVPCKCVQEIPGLWPTRAVIRTAPGHLISFRWPEPGPEIVGPNVVNYS